tara:strand:- start:1314 stop:2111 length:798 start_codon:yes stop_codon:yes gene_type:complete
MVILVLVACSKSKAHEPPEELVWGPDTDLGSWNRAWRETEAERYEAGDLYTGRGTRQQLEMAVEHRDAIPYLISAGAGLVKISDGIKIPPYESTFSRNGGPSPEQWHLLPHGGLTNLELDEEDRVVVFAPPAYLRALSRDPGLDRIAGNLVAPIDSPLLPSCLFPVRIHPRIKEVLGVAAADLNTELIRIYLDDGIPGIERLSDEAEDLSPLPERRRVDNEELLEIVKQHHHDKTQMELIRFIRDNLQISASVERIGEARKVARR